MTVRAVERDPLSRQNVVVGTEVPFQPTLGQWFPVVTVVTEPVLIDGFEVSERLGSGAMGSVYQARRRSTGCPIALKVVHFQSLPVERREVFRLRFRRESLLSLSLDHPHLVRGHDTGMAGSSGWLAMEFVEGPNLAQLLEASGTLPPDSVVVVLSQLGQALRYLGSRGVVHRDIKPANVIVGRGGVAKLCDFGLSRSGGHLTVRVTGSGAPLGTVDTMPPEQVKSGHDADARSDLYSLGATAFWLLSGRPPFVAENPYQVMASILDRDPEPLASIKPDLEPELCALVDTLLRKDPVQRVQTAADLLDRLEPIVDARGLHDPVVARRTLAGMAGVSLPAAVTSDSGDGTRLAPGERPPLTLSLQNDDFDFEQEFQAGEGADLGRDRQCDVCLPANSVSRRQCRIEYGRHGIVVMDLGSANGTFVNERRVMKALIRDGDRLRLGKTVLDVCIRWKGAAASSSTHDRELRCEACEQTIPLVAFADGEVISLEGGFLCPVCSEVLRKEAFDLEAASIDAIFEAGFEVVERLDPGHDLPVFRAVALSSGDKASADRRGPMVRIKVCPQIAGVASSRLGKRARIMSEVEHDCVVPTLKVIKRDLLALVVSDDKAIGESLVASVSRAGAMSPAACMRMAIPVARVLVEVTQRLRMEACVSPEEVFLDSAGNGLLRDFGLGISELAHRSPGLLRAREHLGFEGFLPPERIGVQEAPTEAEHVFAFGALLFYALAGTPPVPRSRLAKEEAGLAPGRGLTSDPESKLPSHVPGLLQELVLRCILVSPMERPRHLADVLQQMEAVVRCGGLSSTSGRARKRPRDGPSLSAPVTAPIRVWDKAGRLGESGLVELARTLGERKESGVLVVVSGGRESRIYIREGVVVHSVPQVESPARLALRVLLMSDGSYRFRRGLPDVEGGSGSKSLLELVSLAEKKRR